MKITRSQLRTLIREQIEISLMREGFLDKLMSLNPFDGSDNPPEETNWPEHLEPIRKSDLEKGGWPRDQISSSRISRVRIPRFPDTRDQAAREIYRRLRIHLPEMNKLIGRGKHSEAKVIRDDIRSYVKKYIDNGYVENTNDIETIKREMERLNIRIN